MTISELNQIVTSATGWAITADHPIPGLTTMVVKLPVKETGVIPSDGRAVLGTAIHASLCRGDVVTIQRS